MRAEVRRDPGAHPLCDEGRAQAERAAEESAARVRGDEATGRIGYLISRVERVEREERKKEMEEILKEIIVIVIIAGVAVIIFWKEVAKLVGMRFSTRRECEIRLPAPPRPKEQFLCEGWRGTLAILPCGAKIEIAEIDSFYDPSVPERRIKTEPSSAPECITVYACWNVCKNGLDKCPRLYTLLDFLRHEGFVAEGKKPAPRKADGSDANTPDTIVEYRKGEYDCLPFSAHHICSYPKSWAVRKPARDGVGDAEAEARNSQAEGDPVER